MVGWCCSKGFKAPLYFLSIGQGLALESLMNTFCVRVMLTVQAGAVR